MTTDNTNLLFETLSESEAVTVAGGGPVLTYAFASGKFTNNGNGGGTLTATQTEAFDAGGTLHYGSSTSASLSYTAGADLGNLPAIFGQ